VNWAGVMELKPVLSAPTASSVAERAGMASGDEVLAIAAAGGPEEAAGELDWQAVRSLSDLQWQLTQAVLNGRDLKLQVRRSGASAAAAPAELHLATASVDAAEVDAKL